MKSFTFYSLSAVSASLLLSFSSLGSHKSSLNGKKNIAMMSLPQWTSSCGVTTSSLLAALQCQAIPNRGALPKWCWTTGEQERVSFAEVFCGIVNECISIFLALLMYMYIHPASSFVRSYVCVSCLSIVCHACLLIHINTLLYFILHVHDHTCMTLYVHVYAALYAW